MKGFNSKLSQECVFGLCYYIASKELTTADAITSIYAYCNALYDMGVLTLSERIETTDYCVKRLLERRRGE